MFGISAIVWDFGNDLGFRQWFRVWDFGISFGCYMSKAEMFRLKANEFRHPSLEQGEWTGILEKEVKNFENVLEQVLEQIPSENIERIKKLRSFGTGKKLAKRVRQ